MALIPIPIVFGSILQESEKLMIVLRGSSDDGINRAVVRSNWHEGTQDRSDNCAFRSDPVSACAPNISGELEAFAQAVGTLSTAQGAILMLLMQGRQTREIANLCKISQATAKSHIGKILRKLGVRSRTLAAVKYTLFLDVTKTRLNGSQKLHSALVALARYSEGRDRLKGILGELCSRPFFDDEADFRQRLALLTRTQRSILLRVAKGDLNKQIAYECGITDATVKSHVSEILRRLRVRSRCEAAIRFSVSMRRQRETRETTAIRCEAGSHLFPQELEY